MGNKCCKSKNIRAAQVRYAKENMPKDQGSQEELKSEIEEKEHQEMKEILNDLQQELEEHKKILKKQNENFISQTKNETHAMDKLLNQLESNENELVTYEKCLRVTENNYQELKQKLDTLILKLNSSGQTETALQEFKKEFQNDWNSLDKRSTEERNRLVAQMERFDSEQNVIKSQIESLREMIAQLKSTNFPQRSEKQLSFQTTQPKNRLTTRQKNNHGVVPLTSNPQAFECHLDEEISQWYKTTKNNLTACYGAFCDSDKASLHRIQKFSSKGSLQYICLQNPYHDKYKCHICRHIDLSDIPALP